jgi:AcrR family transcriptional regulator
MSKRKTSGGRPTRAQAALRDERLLKVATESFIAQGYAATSLEAIARRARVALRTIYQQYGGKDKIFAAVVSRQLTQVSSFSCELDSGPHIEASLNRLARELVGTCTTPEAVALQRLMSAESVRFPELMLALTVEGHGKLLATVAGFLAEAHKRQLIRVDNKHFAAKLFLELTVGWSLMLCTVGDRSSVPSAKELRAKVNMFLKTYRC